MSETNEQPNVQGDPEQLGAGGYSALVAERKRADDAEKRVGELEKQVTALAGERDNALAESAAKADALQAELSALQQTNQEQAATIGRLNVGIDTGLPRDLIDRLRGDDDESLRADAAALKAFVPADSPFPKPDPSQGVSGDPGGGSTAEKFASFFDASTS